MVNRTQGADKEARGGGAWTPLYMAAHHGHLSIVQYLSEQGADKEAKDLYGMTPLLRAADKGHLSVVQYLYDQGADKEVRTPTRRRGMLVAAHHVT